MKTSKPPTNAEAREIAEKFRLSYWRACKLLLLDLDFHRDYPAYLIFHNPPKWERYKKIVKKLSEFDEKMGKPSMNPVSAEYLDKVHFEVLTIIDEIKTT